MCQICEGNKLMGSNNFGGRAKMRIYKDGMLELQGNADKFKIFQTIYCPRFDIKYCPICGKNLKEE